MVLIRQVTRAGSEVSTPYYGYLVASYACTLRYKHVAHMDGALAFGAFIQAIICQQKSNVLQSFDILLYEWQSADRDLVLEEMSQLSRLKLVPHPPSQDCQPALGWANVAHQRFWWANSFDQIFLY